MSLGDAKGTELVFLGSSGAIQVPAFFCTCPVCEEARARPEQRRTRASLAVLGRETVLVDASPDLEVQLNREGIRRPDRIFITHWHWDHIGGLAALGEPASCAQWPTIDLYLPEEAAGHFDEELAYLARVFDIHPIRPGDRIKLPDAAWEVVKTTHCDHSVGFIVESSKRVAYLVDGVTPPPATVERVRGVDVLILEATLDELHLPPGEKWQNFSLEEALDCWKEIGAERCILTHLSCHSWDTDHLVAGMSDEERQEIESRHEGLAFAHDGMRVGI